MRNRAEMPCDAVLKGVHMSLENDEYLGGPYEFRK